MTTKAMNMVNGGSKNSADIPIVSTNLIRNKECYVKQNGAD